MNSNDAVNSLDKYCFHYQIVIGQMQFYFRNTHEHYGLVARILHWFSVILLLMLVVSIEQIDVLMADTEKSSLIKQHASLGIVLLIIMCFRGYWRLVNLNPIHSYHLPKWQKFTAISLHRAIYIIVIVQSIVGFCNLFFSGKGIPFFGLFESHALMPKNKSLFELSGAFHYMLSVIIYPLITIHISAAIYYQLMGVSED